MRLAALGGAAGLGLGSTRAAAATAQRTTTEAPPRTLIRGADILTMDPTLGELSGADVILEHGRIAAVGKGLSADDAVVIEGHGMILMPGMADGHRHIWQIADAGRLVKTNVKEFAAGYQIWKMKWMPCATAEDHHLAAYYGGLQAIDSGVTALLDVAHGQHTADRALASARGLKESGIAGWFAYQVSNRIGWGPGDSLPLAEARAQLGSFTTDDHWEIVARLQEEVLSDPDGLLRLGIALSVGSKGQPLARVAEQEFGRARAMGIGIITHHANPGPTDIPPGYFGHRGLGLFDLHEAGLLGPDFHCSHGVTATDEELKLMAETGVMLGATAIAETFPSRPLARRDPAHGRARAFGVRTGIGTDTPLSLTQDYFEHIRASFLSLFLDPESEAIANRYHSPDMLEFATRGGYDAIRLGDIGGSIAVGRRADLVLLGTDRPGFPTAGTLADRVVNFAARTDVDSVWVAGRLLKSGGAMVGIDWRALNARIAAMQARIEAAMETITFT
ncbi:amidohydrolase family protein [Enterovirga sp. GCM10030262]|uniref:amidohydrolase family protein n=1 Tax=Enterovirga sp. GCM10030262 TaxID=3273391 RepID=UPI003607BE03